MVKATKVEGKPRRYEFGGRVTVAGVECDAVEIKTVQAKGMERFELDLLSYDQVVDAETQEVVPTVNRVKAVHALTARKGFWTDVRFLKQFGVEVEA